MRDIPIQDMTIERLRAELQAEYNRQAVVDTLNKQLRAELDSLKAEKSMSDMGFVTVAASKKIAELRAELDEAIHDIKLFQKQAIGSNKENSDLEAENEKYLDCLKMILRRDCCSAINNPYCDGGDCDCVWERVCQTIDPTRWNEVKALKGGECTIPCNTCVRNGKQPCSGGD